MENKFSEWTLKDWIRAGREVAVIFVVCYLAVQLFSGNLKLNFSKLSASELVSFLLAFFSISLSAAFYFAATHTSNKFYDYVNKFNTQSSELLGRLEERIKSLNDKQDEIRNRFNSSYLQSGDGNAEAELRNNQQRIMEVQASLENAYKDLMVKAGIEGEEKSKLEAELQQKDRELEKLQKEQTTIIAMTIANLKQYIIGKIEKFGVEKAVGMDPDKLFLELYPSFISRAKKDLLKCEFIKKIEVEDRYDITQKGLSFMVELVLSAVKKEL